VRFPTRFLRSAWGGAALAASWALTPGAACADDVQDQLQRMNARISDLEQQLEATQDELTSAKTRVEAQEQVIERAGLAESRASLSGLARFVEQTRFDGWVATSYWYNANRPVDGSGRLANRGNPALGTDATGLAYPFHPDHNSFQLDQLWFKLVNEATPESRAGFGVDILFGQTADALRGAGGGNGDLSSVFQAYAQFLAPVGPGVLVTAGRFATPIGVERKETVHNFNVTDGLLDTLLQPNNHVGVTVQSAIGPLTLLVGASNDSALNLNSDLNDRKALLWSVGVALTQTLHLALNGLWGDAGSLPGFDPASPPASFDSNTDRVGIVDLVLRWDPSAVLSTWLDFDYVWTKDLEAIIGGSQARVPGNPRAFAVAAASRYAITPETGFGFRAEVIYGQDNFLDPTLVTGLGDHTLWSLTGTVDHSLAENLVVRVEGRYDAGETHGSDPVFYRDRRPGDFRRDQFVGGVQAYYRF